MMSHKTREYGQMLAEKFTLYLETLIRSPSHSDGRPRIVSTSPHVPVLLQGATAKRGGLRLTGQPARLTRP
jgi:hypothetical protein